MQYYWKIYFWKDGVKSDKYLKNVVLPIFIEDKLDETLDSGELVLDNMPIATKKDFPPKTKCRLERYNTKDYLDKPRTWDFVVEHDDVEEYAGCPDICCHRINLIEASVIAQGMHVDNIALTYELQDVDLNYRTVAEDDTRVGSSLIERGDILRNANHKNVITKHTDVATMKYYTGTFLNTYKYEWDENSLNGERGIKNILKNVHAENPNLISFNVPQLYLSGCYNEGYWTRLFELCTLTRVYKVLKQNGAQISREAINIEGATLLNPTRKYSGANSFEQKNDDVCYCTNNSAYIRKIYSYSTPVYLSGFEKEFTTFNQVAIANINYTKEISFNTEILSTEQLRDGYTIDYEIECMADPSFQSGMITKYEQHYNYMYRDIFNQGIKVEGNCTTITDSKATASEIYVEATINCYDLSTGKTTPFIKKGVKYSCYDLVRKALLTCDTHVIDNETTSLDEYGYIDEPTGKQGAVPSITYPIFIEPDIWNAKLKKTKMQETVFECKNLWEVFLQVGYYLHAVPRLVFDGEDAERFMLTFDQLGGTTKKENTKTKMTVFSSLNLSEFFTQYDSYVTNLFSPQNECEEWLTCKTSDPSFLISNDTAELHLKYAITEVTEFKIIYEGIEKNAIQYIFEKSIYDVLTNGDPSQVSPAKGNAIYYTLGDNKIKGLSYVAPAISVGDNLMALKYIMQKLYGVTSKIWTQKHTFNDIRFKIKYRTQDTARVTQFKPDLERFVKNSNLEKYPHHEQFYGQQDKIVDSERFSANLWGKLIRVGNEMVQCQEYARIGEDKRAGELVEIDNIRYYVTAIESEYYPDAIFQKVTYSKNFNQLANIVTIPSEPRFYEVSERSKIRREVRLFDFFTLTTKKRETNATSRFISESGWLSFIKSLLFKKEKELPNYAWTRFMADKKRIHSVNNNELFPSSDIRKTGDNTYEPLASSDHSDCIVPVLHFPLHDGIVFEWDMEDNFKCGDMVDTKISGEGNTADKAYLSMQPMRYVDIMGRADLFRFALFNKTNWTPEQMQQLPKAVIEPPHDSIIAVRGSERSAIALDKDNREELSFNYQINLLHNPHEDDQEDFITFPNLFGKKDANLKVCLLNKVQTLFNESIDISDDSTLADNLGIDFNSSTSTSLAITFGNPNWVEGADISKVNSIVFYYDNETFGKTAIIAKNVSKLPDSKKLQPWYIYPVFND